jgi:Flp pilus assembly protein TadG
MFRSASVRARATKIDRSNDRDERGSSAVEFALVLPFLVTIILGIIAYSYMFSVRQAITQASAEGARAGAVAVTGTSATEATAAVNDALAGYGLTCGTGGLTCTPTVSGGSIAVKVSYAYSANAKMKFPFVPLPANLDFTSSARIN